MQKISLIESFISYLLSIKDEKSIYLSSENHKILKSYANNKLLDDNLPNLEELRYYCCENQIKNSNNIESDLFVISEDMNLEEVELFKRIILATGFSLDKSYILFIKNDFENEAEKITECIFKQIRLVKARKIMIMGNNIFSLLFKDRNPFTHYLGSFKNDDKDFLLLSAISWLLNGKENKKNIWLAIKNFFNIK